jgi:hypothetical protein
MALLDWNNPPQLRTRKREARDLDALSRSHARRVKHKASKAHSTNKERSAETRAKNTIRNKLLAAQKEIRAKYLAAVRAYWSGRLRNG